jgi:hypothetical protein
MFTCPPAKVTSIQESTTLQDYLNSSVVIDSEFIETSGYTSPGDGGQGIYRQISTNPLSVDWPKGSFFLRPVDDVLNPLQFGAETSPTFNSTSAFALMTEASRLLHKGIEIPGSADGFSIDNWILHSQIKIWATGGVSDSVITQRPGATGGLLAWNGTDRVTNALIQGLYLFGNSGADTQGLLLDGISYSTFINIWSRNFEDGIFADGQITPNFQQVSNNTLINVRSNNNKRNGLRMINSSPNPLKNANTAMTFVGCEFAGNDGAGIYDDQSEVVVMQGVTIQGNGGTNYINSVSSKFVVYTEEGPDAFAFGPDARVDFEFRSSYNWTRNFILDDNLFNQKIRWLGSTDDPLHLFNSVNKLDSSEVNMLGGGSTLTNKVFNSPDSFSGIEFLLNKSALALQGQWVTLAIQMDTSSIVNPLEWRCYAVADGSSSNVNGEVDVSTFPGGISGGMHIYYFVMRFPNSGTTAATIQLYLNYGTGGTTVNIPIQNAWVYEGYHCSLPMNANMQMFEDV